MTAGSAEKMFVQQGRTRVCLSVSNDSQRLFIHKIIYSDKLLVSKSLVGLVHHFHRPIDDGQDEK